MMTDIGERVPTIPTQLVPGNYVRARTRSERPLSNPPAIASAASYPSNSSSTPHTTSRGANQHLSANVGGGHGDGGPKISDRLSGWFNHTFNTSANDLSLPHILQRSTSPTNLTLPTSPDRRLLQNGGINSNIDARSGSSTEGSNSNKGGGGKVHGLLTAARTGKGHLDRAMRYILDTDAAPDRCTSPIWVLGVEHPGFSPSPNHSPSSSTSGGRRSSISVEQASVRSNGSREREREEASLSRSTPPGGGGGRKSKDHRRNGGGDGGDELGLLSFEEAGKGWPPEFYNDFTSRVWLTYRSQFPPIRDTTLHALDSTSCSPSSFFFTLIDLL